jgi:hypothetical protein
MLPVVDTSPDAHATAAYIQPTPFHLLLKQLMDLSTETTIHYSFVFLYRSRECVAGSRQIYKPLHTSLQLRDTTMTFGMQQIQQASPT